MTTFTASNGIGVMRLDAGYGFRNVPDSQEVIGCSDGVSRYGINDAKAQALREFFLHERDEQLGRWRWPERPDYVVTPFDGDPDHVLVVQESAGVACEFVRASAYGPSMSGYHSRLAPAARAYFDAHPEPKPWHDAEPGEVWVLTVDGSEEFPCSVSPSGPDFEPIAHPVWATLARGSDRITSARRIWPEEPS